MYFWDYMFQFHWDVEQKDITEFKRKPQKLCFGKYL